MPCLAPRLSITEPLVGIGVDLCDTQRFVGVRERWGGRVDRVFSATELNAFGGARLGWCWASREAIVKALRGRMLGSPLADMVVGEPHPGQLVYRPRERARAQLSRHGVTRVELHTTTVAGVAMVVALALGRIEPGAAPTGWDLAWGALPWRSKKEASALARRAGGLALRQLTPTWTTARWEGGHGSPPDLSVEGTREGHTLVSLTHDGGLSAAVVAVARGHS